MGGLAVSRRSRLKVGSSPAPSEGTNIVIAPVASTQVRGNIESVGLDGNLSGWAADLDFGSVSNTVEFYADGVPGVGAFMGAIATFTLRSDVNTAFSITGNHGFSWQVPTIFRTAAHQFHVYSVSVANGARRAVTNSPISYTPPTASATITSTYQYQPITLKVSSDTFAGAVYSLTWNGVEFINYNDHGRQIQSAVQFNSQGEANNPTEAGSSADARGLTSTSVLNEISSTSSSITTEAQMAYWLPLEGDPLSDTILTKTVTIGAQGLPNVIHHETTFNIPAGYTASNFEGVTGYMPSSFSRFWQYNPDTQVLAEITNYPGIPTQSAEPLIFATPDGAYAMGAYSPTVGGIYWYWRASTTSKWNADWQSKANPSAGNHSFDVYYMIGSLSDVASTMTALVNAL